MKLFILLFGVLIFFTACAPAPTINSFMECVNAGNPVMESYPRQCSANGQTFTEEIAPELHICTDEENAAEICTMDYNPVCGLVDNGIRCITTPCPSTDAVTYSNGCGACSAGALGYYRGLCEEISFVVCGGETFTGFDPEKFADDSGGICVEVCPGNYDAYMTQIGIEMCIISYNKETIEGWDICERSSTDCNCVKAYETTKEEPIENAKYRCVPEEYSERLLFRSGIDRLDEKGKQSVMIA